jgi:hypothetical protein
MKKNPIAVVVIVAIIVGVIAFYAGTVVGKGSSSSLSGRRNFNPSGNGAGFARNGGANGGFVNGEILKQDATSITVKMRDGTSRIVFLSGTTTVQKTVSGSVSDLAVGEQVMVTGKQSSDGTVAAETVQIRPAIPGGVNPNTNLNSNPPSNTNS